MTYQRNETPEPLASGDELKPLPCPFCGGVSVSAAEGSTFRYWVASCNECGATAGEVRRQTLGEGTNAEWDIAARAKAIKEWNTRATQADAPEAGQEAAQQELVPPNKIIALAEKCSAEVGRHDGQVVWVKFHSLASVEAFATGIVLSAAIKAYTPVAPKEAAAHKQGCSALGGYGHGVGPCDCRDVAQEDAADPWHTAVLNECMLTEACYQEADPVATVKALIDWHVANGTAVQAVGADARDAARYRWLRTPPNNIDGRVYGQTFAKDCGGLLRRGTYLDDAIDAALSGSLGDGAGMSTEGRPND